MKKILLDTNAYTSFLAGDKRVLDALTVADTVFISVIVLGELHAGFRGGTRFHENKAGLERFLDKPTVSPLDVTSETAEIFGQIKNALRKTGTPIPINDVWLAAQTTETGSIIISYDNHFNKVPGLRTWDFLLNS